MSSSSDSDGSEYSIIEELYADAPTTTIEAIADSSNIVQSKTSNQIESDELLAIIDQFEAESLLPPNKKEWLHQILTKTIHTYNDGEIIKSDANSDNVLFVIKGEITVTEQNQVSKAGVAGDFFGHIRVLFLRSNLESSSYKQHISVSRGGTKCAFLSSDEIFQHIPLLPALLLLHETQWLKDLNYACREFIASKLISKLYSPNETLIVQNQTGSGLFIIVRGTCIVTQNNSETGETHTLTRLHPGHFFGEMSLMNEEDQTVANVVCGDKPVACVFFSTEDARSLLKQEILFEQALNMEIQRKSKLASRKKSVAGQNREDLLYRSASMERMDQFQLSPHRKIRHSTMVTRTKTMTEKGAKRINTINGYRVLHTLGQGSYGKVKLVEDTLTGHNFAMKIINRSILKHCNALTAPSEVKNKQIISEKDILMREVTLMKQMRHPNLVNLVEVIDDEEHDYLYIISEFCNGGTIMNTSVGKDNALTLDKAHTAFRDLIRGVVFMHSQGIVHRDIKPENLLLDASGALKICDFGCSEMVGHQTISSIKGTPAFMAPELLLGLISSNLSPFACDMYSIGACLFMFVEGRPPYWERNEIEMVERLRRGVPPSFSQEITVYPNLTNLLRGLLNKNPNKRLIMRNVVLHDWTTQENSQPVYKTDFLMEEALKDVSDRSRALLNINDIENAISMSTISFHVIAKSTNWLKRARSRLQSSASNGGNGSDVYNTQDGAERYSNGSSPRYTDTSRYSDATVDTSIRLTNNLANISEVPKLKLQQKKSRKNSFCRVLNKLCCIKATNYVVPYSAHHLSPPGSPSPQLISMFKTEDITTEEQKQQQQQQQQQLHKDNFEEQLKIEKQQKEEIQDTSDESEEDDFELLEGDSALATIIVGPTKTSKYATLPTFQVSGIEIVNALHKLNTTHGTFTSQGRLEYQEDRFSTLETLIEASSLNNTTEHRLSLYGVYDGHGGAEVSEMLSNRILDFIVEHLNYQKKNNINTLEDVSRKNEFICLFQQFDKEILDDQMSMISQLSPKTYHLNRKSLPLVLHLNGTKAETRKIKTISRTNSSKSVTDNVHSISKSLNTKLTVDTNNDQAVIDCNKIKSPNSLRRFQSDASVLKKSRTMDGFKNLSKAPGSTGTVVLIEKHALNTILHVGWLGDSKCVLSSKNQTVELSEDHRATNPNEIKRIQDIGGIISRGRINGSLQISRSFGDPAQKEDFLNQQFPVKYKALVTAMTPKGRKNMFTNNDDDENENEDKNEITKMASVIKESKKRIILTKDSVINVPGYFCKQIEIEDEFLLIGSDGLWDVVEVNEAVQLARHYISQGLSLEQVSQKLVEAATSRGTDDNTTLMIVSLQSSMD